MGRLLEAVLNLADSWAEFHAWQDDWRRTWSPVSYYLAAAVLVGFLVMAFVFGEQAWQYIATWVRTAA